MALILDGTDGITSSGGTNVLQDDAVITANIADGAVSDAKIAAMAAAKLTGDVAAARITTALNAPGSAPIFAARAWVNFNGTDTVTIRASGNVSSLTDLGTGQYLVNFTTNMSDVNFSAVATCNETDNGTVCQARLAAVSNIAIDIYDSPSGLTNRRADPTNVNVAIFR